jgi:hypothetical protein
MMVPYCRDREAVIQSREERTGVSRNLRRGWQEQ